MKENKALCGILLCGLILLTFSCTTINSELTNGEYKYWYYCPGKYTYDNNYNHVVDSIDVIYDNNSGVTPYIVYFDKKGTYKKFYCCNGVFEEEPLDDIYLPLSGFDKWQVVNDSMFTAGRDTYTVIDSFNGKLVIVKTKSDYEIRKSIDTLIAVDEEKVIPKEFRKILTNPVPYLGDKKTLRNEAIAR